MREWSENTLEEVVESAREAFYQKAQGDKDMALRLASEQVVNLLADVGRLQTRIEELSITKEKLLDVHD